MGYVFISYSTANQSSADAVRALFLRNGISAWMAPYNIPAGCEYAEVIADALSGCACLVLVLTARAQDSVWVKKEINLAVSDGKTIIPIKLEDIVLNSSMRLYLNDQQIVSVSELDENSPEMQKVLAAVRAYTGATPVTEARPEEQMPATFAEPDPADPWECYRRGYAHEMGESTPVDYAKAAYWYEMGAKAGNAWCQHRMGEFCLLGIGRPQDFEAAVGWYALGAEQKDHSSCARLAECYENGWGVAQDAALAAAWREKAAQYQ